MSIERQDDAPATHAGQAPAMSGAAYESAPPGGSANTGLVVIAVAGVVLAAGGLAWNILGPGSAPAAPPAPAPTARTFMSEQAQLMRDAVQMAREAQQMQREHMARIEAQMRGEFGDEYTGAVEGGSPR